ncbi:hypothetical protein CCACVL1_16058 [Corchorus capsularis]|uniref:HAT C-terminal dimerisation domain-containing protein n=1 Tax=Corchorus capsularis TaxID=210143 RepID=A0A1R3HZH7_COCAP|nr:hypothetical protein CCACVL1_16058 [Corchorus capsularis]
MAAVLDPRCKMVAVEFCFRKLFSEMEARENIVKVRKALYEIYAEYVSEYRQGNGYNGENQAVMSDHGDGRMTDDSKSGWSEYSSYLKEVQESSPDEAELDSYLKECCFIFQGDPMAFEASFSAGGRVIDTYRASLAPETVQALLCGGDWVRNLHGVKKKGQGDFMKVVTITLCFSFCS